MHSISPARGRPGRRKEYYGKVVAAGQSRFNWRKYQTLFAEDFKHSIGPWYQAALVFDGQEMRHYVNGHLELAGEMDFMPFQSGQISIGVRLNRVFWYRGKVSSLRFVDRALRVEEFLQV